MKKLSLINLIIVTAIILFLTTNCKKDKFTSLPVLATTSISTLADSYAESKSKVVNDGGADITARGVCWSVNPDPSIKDAKTDDDGGVGTYFSKIEGLTAGTLYHLRAYATNAIGTGYSEEITFSTKATLPTLSTTPVSGIATSSAMSGGNITYDGGGTITARGVCWGTTLNPTTSNLKTTDGTGPGLFTSKIEGLTSGTVYHLRAYATNLLGTAYGADITFSTSAVLPTITTSPVSAVTSSTATSGGTVASDGGASVTARGVCWSANANPTTSDSKTSDGNGSGQFVSNVTALSAGATYHLRAYATNSAGTAYGADITFITSGQVPASVSQQATNLSITGATLNGVVNANNLSTTVTFEYGLSTSYGMTVVAAQSPVTGNSITNVSADIAGLTQGTTYHFRVKTVNSLGTVYSGDMTFVTPNFATLNTVIMSAITSVSATSGGNIITDGGAPVNARGVCWNTSGNPTVVDNKSSDGAGTGSYVSQLSALMPNTTYYVRSYATNSLGTSYGNQISFLTPAAIPTLSTAAITAITSSAATGGGTITSDGGAQITARGICWSSTPNPTTAGTKTINGTGTGSFTGNITGLNPNTTYFVRAYATNSAGTAYGNEIAFNTLAVLPTLTTSVATAITQTTATSGGTIISDGGAAVTVSGVCWSTLANPTVADNKTNDGTGTGTFTSSVTGLLPNTLYYIRAYAVNNIGTAYGNQVSYTTLSANVVPTNGLVGYWPFNANANDESGNNNNGSVSGATLTADRHGNLNHAYNFDGINDYIAIAPSSLVDNETAITVSCWLKRDATDDYGLPYHTGNQGRVGIQVKKDSVTVNVTTNSTLVGPTCSTFFIGWTKYNQSEWSHIILRYDGASISLYINGELKKSTYAEGNIWTPQSSYLALGVYMLFGNPNHGYYKGILDDVRLYNRALNTTEIQSLYNEGN
jgi:hypothetical protein